MDLAVGGYAGIERLSDGSELLNLACALDENEFLQINLFAMLANELRREGENQLPLLRRYLLNDPYGARMLRAAVSSFFGVEFTEGEITAGAGVGPLLCALARLAPTGAICIVGETYPDFPVWATRAQIPLLGNADASAAIHFLERPGFATDPFANLAAVADLCRRAADASAIVVIDESNANYHPPSYSAIPLIRTHANLVVLRGMSKAYQLGSLRIGFCLASPLLSERVRGVVAPLLASSLSLGLAAAILKRGDLTAPLGRRIAFVRRELMPLFAALPFGPPLLASEGLPYAFWPDASPAKAFLDATGVVGKMHSRWLGAEGRIAMSYRISLPLNQARLNSLKARITV